MAIDEDQAVINLPIEVLRAAVVGLLVEEGWEVEAAWRLTENVNDPEFQRMVRKVASVALTLQSHGLLKEPSVH